MKTIDDLKRETAALIQGEHEKRLDRDAREKRDGPVLDAFDRIADGRSLVSDATPPRRHAPRLALVPDVDGTPERS